MLLSVFSSPQEYLDWSALGMESCSWMKPQTLRCLPTLWYIPCSQFPAWCTRSCVLSIQNFPKAWHEAKWQALFLQLSSLKYYFYFARRKAWSAGIGKWWKKLVDNFSLWNPWCWRSESSAAVMLWLLQLCVCVHECSCSLPTLPGGCLRPGEQTFSINLIQIIFPSIVSQLVGILWSFWPSLGISFQPNCKSQRKLFSSNCFGEMHF